MADLLTYILDYRNPLVSYAYLIIIAFIFRALFIVIPLIRIAIRYYRKGMLKKVFKLKRITKLKGIEGFILTEILVMLSPGALALIFRFGFLGSPPELIWNHLQLLLACAVGILWLAYDIRETMKVRNSLNTVLLWYENPNKVSKILDDILWTRERLGEVSKWEIETERESEIDVDETPIAKVGNFITSRFESVKAAMKSTIKEGARIGAERIDTTLQSRVDEVVSDSPPRQYKSFFSDLIMNAIPLIVIYWILPTIS